MSVGRSVVDVCFLVSAASLMLRAAHARNPEASSQTALRGENVFVMFFPFCYQQRMCRVRIDLSKLGTRTSRDMSVGATTGRTQTAYCTGPAIRCIELALWLPWAVATPFISRRTG